MGIIVMQKSFFALSAVCSQIFVQGDVDDWARVECTVPTIFVNFC